MSEAIKKINSERY